MVSAVVPPITGEAVGAMPTMGMWAPSLLVAVSFIQDVLFWGTLLLPTLSAAIVLFWLVRWVIALLLRRTQSPAHAPGIIVCVSVGMLLFLVYALDLLDSHSSLWGLETLLGLLLLLVTGLRLRYAITSEDVMPNGEGRRGRLTFAVAAVVVAVALFVGPVGRRAIEMAKLCEAYNRASAGAIVRCSQLPAGMYIETRHGPNALFPELGRWYGLATTPWPTPHRVRFVDSVWRWRYTVEARPVEVFHFGPEGGRDSPPSTLRALAIHGPPELRRFFFHTGATRLLAWAVDRGGSANLFVLAFYLWESGQAHGANCVIVRLIDDGLMPIRAAPFVDLGFAVRSENVRPELVDMRARSADDTRGMELALTTEYDEGWSPRGYVIVTEDDLASLTGPIELAIDRGEPPPGLHLRDLPLVRSDATFHGTGAYGGRIDRNSPPHDVRGRASGILWLRWNLCLVRRD